MTDVVYDLLYTIVKNHCIAIGCESCENSSHPTLTKVFKGRIYCGLITRFSSPLDKMLKIIPSNGSKHPLWDVFMKYCNRHYIYGRFDCCKGCKFYTNNVCKFNKIWGNVI